MKFSGRPGTHAQGFANKYRAKIQNRAKSDRKTLIKDTLESVQIIQVYLYAVHVHGHLMNPPQKLGE